MPTRVVYIQKHRRASRKLSTDSNPHTLAKSILSTIPPNILNRYTHTPSDVPNNKAILCALCANLLANAEAILKL